MLMKTNRLMKPDVATNVIKLISRRAPISGLENLLTKPRVIMLMFHS